MSWRWRLSVAGVVTVLLAVAATFVLPLSESDEGGATTSRSSSTAPAGVATTTPSAAPSAERRAPRAPAGEPPAARVTTSAPRLLRIDRGGVGLSQVRTAFPGTGVLVVAYRLDRRASVAIEVIDGKGRRLGRETNRIATAGAQTEILRLPKSAGLTRVVIAASRIDDATSPTIATLAVRAGAPRLRVLAPTANSVIRGRKVVVRLAATNFRIVGQGKRPRRQEGHYHLTLDGRSYIVIYRSSFTFDDVPPGRHTLVIQPSLNDHSAAPTLRRRVIRFRTVAG